MGQTQRVSGRATRVSGTHPGQTLRVQYHDTVVVSRDANGLVTLDSGGYRTVTTKLRMNQTSNQYGLGYSVFQKAGDWFVCVGRDWDHRIPFTDGMTIDTARRS